jgi:xeroderma pigmentosum group C-complementing protein
MRTPIEVISILDDDSDKEGSSEMESEIMKSTHLPSRWVHVDVNKALIDEPLGVEERRGRRIMYAFAFDDTSAVMDVSSRYTNQFSLSSNDRLRSNDVFLKTIVSQWSHIYAFRITTVDEIVSSCSSMETKEENVDEHVELQQHITSAPMPTTIHAFKDHSVYVLERYLKKTEALHPTFKHMEGIVKGEVVYKREHVVELKSKAQWKKEFRRIKIDEVPYRKLERKRNEESRAVFLFGIWQTEIYSVPEVQNGLIPVNKYGNIEVWDGDTRFVPRGAVLVTELNALKCAKQLGIQHSSAGSSVNELCMY